jgi:hypothetical protein
LFFEAAKAGKAKPATSSVASNVPGFQWVRVFILSPPWFRLFTAQWLAQLHVGNGPTAITNSTLMQPTYHSISLVKSCMDFTAPKCNPGLSAKADF